MAFAKDWNDMDRRIERLAAVVCAKPEWVEGMLFTYDWPNQAEHDEWLQTATDTEITSWLFGLEQFGEGK